nr:WG repeat-containing protein [Comamonas testosteroni]
MEQTPNWCGAALVLVMALNLGAADSVRAQEFERGGCMRGVEGTESALQEVCQFSEGLAAFKMNGLWGYMDREGRVRIEPQFKNAQAFSQGLAAVQQHRRSSSDCGCDQDSDESKWGFIAPDGNWVIEPKFYNAGNFRQGLARVLIPRTSSMDNIFIDRQGRQALPGNYAQAQSFIGSLALVESADYRQSFVTRDGKSVDLPKPPAHLPVNTKVRITAGRAEPERWLAKLEAPAQAFSASGRMLPLKHGQRFELPVSPTAAVVEDRGERRGKGLMDEQGRWLLAPEFFRLDDFDNGVGVAGREVAESKAEKPAPNTARVAGAITPPAPPSMTRHGREYFLVSAAGKLLTPAYAEIRRERGFFVAKAQGNLYLLGARGERLSTLACKSDTYYPARALSSDRSGWSVVNTCDGQHWVQNPEGRSWSGTGEAQAMRTTSARVLLRLKDDAQLYDRQGKVLLSSSMRVQLKGLDAVWLTADEDNPASKASRPQAIFLTRTRNEDSKTRYSTAVQLHALTAAGRWVRLPDSERAEVYWRPAEGLQNLAAPVLLRTADGIGMLDAEGGWRLKPDRNLDFYSVPGGWVGVRGRQGEPDQLWNGQGQKVVLKGSDRAHEVAPGISWLEQDGHWQLLDAHKARLQPLPEADGAQITGFAGGQVVMTQSAQKADADDGEGRDRLQALYSAQGKRLTPWLRLDDLLPIQDEKKTVHGWVGTRWQDAGEAEEDGSGRFSMLFSREGKPLTQLLPLSLRPVEGQARLVSGSAGGKGVMTPKGQVMVPALYGYISDAKHGWIKTNEGAWDGLLDAQGRWLAVVPSNKAFEELAENNVTTLGSAYDAQGAVDINGRLLQRVQAGVQRPEVAELPPRRWQVMPSPMPAREQFPVDDEKPANWFVQGTRENAVLRDMKGGVRLKAAKGQSLNVLNATVTRKTHAGSANAISRTELLNARAGQIAVFEAADLLINREGRLTLASEQPLPADHPLARTGLQLRQNTEVGVDAPHDSSAKSAKDATALQFSLVNEADGQVLGGRFDALGELHEGRSFVSHMGNLGVVDAQGKLMVQSAWRCGSQPVLLDGAGEISWPAELRGQARLECPKP